MALGIGAGGASESGGSSSTNTIKFKNICTTSSGSTFGGYLYFRQRNVKLTRLKVTLTSKGSQFYSSRNIYIGSNTSAYYPHVTITRDDPVGTVWDIDCTTYSDSYRYSRYLYINPSSYNNRAQELCTFDIELEYEE